MFTETWDLIDRYVAAEKAGTQDPYKEYCPVYNKSKLNDVMDRRRALAQLGNPDKNNPIALIGYRLPILKDEDHISVSEDLSKFVEPCDEKNLQVLMTPQFWVSDLHIDNSDGMSWTVDRCQKFWMTFPPTKKNIAILLSDGYQRSKLGRIGNSLEGGIIFRASSDQAAYGLY